MCRFGSYRVDPTSALHTHLKRKRRERKADTKTYKLEQSVKRKKYFILKKFEDDIDIVTYRSSCIKCNIKA